MKKLEIIIKPEKLEIIKAILDEQDVNGMNFVNTGCSSDCICTFLCITGQHSSGNAQFLQGGDGRFCFALDGIGDHDVTFELAV